MTTNVTEHYLLREIPLSEIHADPADNPRTEREPARDAELAESIRRQGMLSPVLVSPENGRFRLLAGFRRHGIARALGWEAVPAQVYEGPGAPLTLALTENLQRDDMSALDEARAIERLRREAKLGTTAIAARLSRSESFVRGAWSSSSSGPADSLPWAPAASPWAPFPRSPASRA